MAQAIFSPHQKSRRKSTMFRRTLLETQAAACPDRGPWQRPLRGGKRFDHRTG